MPLRYENSPYIHQSSSPNLKVRGVKVMEKPWRVNMNKSNKNFVEFGEDKRFLNSLHKDVAMN